MENCIFCRIIAKNAPAALLYEDEEVIAIEDIHPVARVHFLVIPKKHVDSLNELASGDEPLVAHMIATARGLAQARLGPEAAYRLVINTGADAGQSVFHLHLHIISGRPFLDRLLTRGLR